MLLKIKEKLSNLLSYLPFINIGKQKTGFIPKYGIPLSQYSESVIFRDKTKKTPPSINGITGTSIPTSTVVSKTPAKTSKTSKTSAAITDVEQKKI